MPISSPAATALPQHHITSPRSIIEFDCPAANNTAAAALNSANARFAVTYIHNLQLHRPLHIVNKTSRQQLTLRPSDIDPTRHRTEPWRNFEAVIIPSSGAMYLINLLAPWRLHPAWAAAEKARATQSLALLPVLAAKDSDTRR